MYAEVDADKLEEARIVECRVTYHRESNLRDTPFRQGADGVRCLERMDFRTRGLYCEFHMSFGCARGDFGRGCRDRRWERGGGGVLS